MYKKTPELFIFLMAAEIRGVHISSSNLKQPAAMCVALLTIQESLVSGVQ